MLENKQIYIFPSLVPMGNLTKRTHSTWNFDVGLPPVVVASSVKLHISSKGIGVDWEAIGDNFATRGYGKTGLCLMVFPKKGEGNP